MVYLKLMAVFRRKKTKICMKVVVGEKVSQGIHKNGRNQKNSPPHLKRNTSSNIEPPSSPKYNLVKSGLDNPKF